jgi:hypothetical protein
MVIEPLPWFQRHEGRRDHFLNSQVRIVPNNNENLPTETSFSVKSTLTPLLAKKDEAFVVTCETTRTGIDDNQDINEYAWSE